MSEVNIFEEASRRKLRFKAKAGYVSIEDLWDLPLKQIDEIAVAISDDINEKNKGSFLNPKSGPDEVASLCLSILLFVIEKRQAETKAAKEAADKRAQKSKLLDIIAQKQDQQLTEMSVEELMAKVNAL